MTFSDPEPLRSLPGQRRSPAELLSDQLEEVTDAYASACDASAEAENEYLRAYARSFTTSECAATIRPKTAECAAVEERAAWNLASAVEKSARAKVEEVRHRLMAAMSHARIVGGQS